MKIVMKKRGVLLLVAFIAITWKGFAQDTTALTGMITLKQCVDIAIKNNLAVNEADFTAQNNKVGIRQSLGQMLPYISGSLSQTESQGRAISSSTNTYVTQNLSYGNYSLSGTEYLWNGGSIRNYLAASKLTYNASKMDLQQQKDLITINVILGYLQILSNEEQLKATIQQLASTREQLTRYQTQDSSGALSNPQLLTDLQGSAAATEVSIIALQNAIESSKIALVQYLNLPYSSFDVQPLGSEEDQPPVLYDASSDIIFQQAMQNLALVKSAHLKTLSAIKSFKAARGQLFPTLTLNGGLASNYSSAATDALGNKTPYGQQLGNNFNNYFGLSLSIPILNGLVAKSRLDLARITERRTSFEEKNVQTTLQQNVKQAYINMQTSFDKYQKTQDEIKAYRESFRIAEVRFNAGLYTSLEYITAKNNVDQAVINLIAIKYDYILRTKILDYYQSKLSLTN